MKLITVDRFRGEFFEKGSAPDPRTVRSWIDQGIVPGRVLGKKAYVDKEALEAGTSSELVSRVMEAS